jgi:phosphohistidine phosphatase
MRDHLERVGVRPDLVLCSSAVRARQTLDAVLPALGDPAIEIESALYTFSGRVLADRLRAVPADVACVMLVGHNPAIHELALTLAGSGERLGELRAKYPTGALAGIDVADRPATGSGAGRLLAFVTPRELA